jgi:TPR repeat protein
LFFARRTTVLAYINTLFNLGLKYEAGVDKDRQVPEAMRYYRKAAQLGNLPARARVKIKEAQVLSPLPPGEG